MKSISEGKACRDCGHWHPFADFGKNQRRKDGHKSYCKPCERERGKAARLRNHEQYLSREAERRSVNRDKIRAQEAVRREANPEQFKRNQDRYRQIYREELNSRVREARKDPVKKARQYLGARKWRNKNAEYVQAKHREYRIANAERLKKSQREYRASNKERYLENSRRYRLAHPESKRISEANRRALKKQSEGFFSESEWMELCERCCGKCLACGKESRLTIDHVVPLSKGGAHAMENIQPLCRPCNSKKGTNQADYR